MRKREKAPHRWSATQAFLFEKMDLDYSAIIGRICCSIPNSGLRHNVRSHRLPLDDFTVVVTEATIIRGA